jgi:hypothetical protein
MDHQKMTTRINTAHGTEKVTDHQRLIPLNSDGTVDYQAIGWRLIKEYGKEVKNNLCEVF